jgi:hypothetical protein
MKVTVVRSGGFAGIERRAEADTSEEPELAELSELAARDDLAPPPREEGNDRFVYEFDLGGRTVTLGESQLTEPLRELVRRLFGR